MSNEDLNRFCLSVILVIEKASGFKWEEIISIHKEVMMAWKCVFVEECVHFVKSLEGVTPSQKPPWGGRLPKNPRGGQHSLIRISRTPCHPISERVLSQYYNIISAHIGMKRSSIYYYLNYKKGAVYKANRERYNAICPQKAVLGLDG